MKNSKSFFKVLLFLLITINCGAKDTKGDLKKTDKEEAKITFEKPIQVNSSEEFTIDGVIDIGKENEVALGPRIDDFLETQSYQVVKISDERTPSEYVSNNYESKIVKTNSTKLLVAIDNYIDQHKKYESNSNYIMNHLKSKFHLEKVLKAKTYLKNNPDLEFTSLKGTQYCFDCINWKEHKHNIQIIDFETSFLSDAWSSYALLIKYIPTYKVGSALFELKIDNESIRFRSRAQKQIWSFKDHYWAYVEIYVTKAGVKHAPILIEVSDPNRSYEENGTYLVFHKK